MIDHEHLRSIVHNDPRDYDHPETVNPRWVDPNVIYGDCSSSCKWAAWLEGSVGLDWCVCTNPASHRCGLLTFEHQGCLQYEFDEEETP